MINKESIRLVIDDNTSVYSKVFDIINDDELFIDFQEDVLNSVELNWIRL